MDNIKLINDLISQAEKVTYENNNLDVVLKRAKMIIIKVFGEKTHYIKDLNSISFGPMMYFTDSPKNVFEGSFDSGKDELLNLLRVIAEDIQISITINPSTTPKSNKRNNPTITNKVFIVHGHNDEMKHAVARTIEKLELCPIILHEQPNKGKSIIEKFTDNSDVIFAVIILSADDIGYDRKLKADTAKLRARQNVILELGYFLGKLGRDKVIALHEPVYDFEIPSDYSGVLFVPYDKGGSWQYALAKELKSIGIPVDANDIL